MYDAQERPAGFDEHGRVGTLGLDFGDKFGVAPVEVHRLEHQTIHVVVVRRHAGRLLDLEPGPLARPLNRPPPVALAQPHAVGFEDARQRRPGRFVRHGYPDVDPMVAKDVGVLRHAGRQAPVRARIAQPLSTPPFLDELRPVLVHDGRQIQALKSQGCENSLLARHRACSPEAGVADRLFRRLP
ncbi:MAG: hypothetical protein FJ029_05460 [Actinobacteria bacterium]|nr:hypothetical protein [Actinomycetota bacterium]